MWDYVEMIYTWSMSFATRANRHQWMLILLAIAIFGFLCMRGMGRRGY